MEFINQGQIVVEIFDDNIVRSAATTQSIPLNDWCRLVFQFRLYKVFKIKLYSLI